MENPFVDGLWKNFKTNYERIQKKIGLPEYSKVIDENNIDKSMEKLVLYMNKAVEPTDQNKDIYIDNKTITAGRSLIFLLDKIKQVKKLVR